MDCEICFQRFSRKTQRLRLACSCRVCKHCFADWMRSLLPAFGLPGFKITCPQPAHKSQIPDSTLQKMVPSHLFAAYKNTLKKRSIALQSTQTPTSIGQSSELANWCRTVWNAREEFFVFVKKEITTDPCPKCDAHIEKNGGCNHMTCTHCHHEFCWFCKTPYGSGHDSDRCSNYALLLTFWVLFIILLSAVRVCVLLPQELLLTIGDYCATVIMIAFLLFVLFAVTAMNVGVVVSGTCHLLIKVLLLAPADVAAGMLIGYLGSLCWMLTASLLVGIAAAAGAAVPAFVVYSIVNT